MKRETRIKLMREYGMPYSKIGEIEGITEQQARRIFDKQAASVLSTASAARLIGIHPNTLRRWAKEGRITYCRIGSRGDRRFRRRDVKRLLRAG